MQKEANDQKNHHVRRRRHNHHLENDCDLSLEEEVDDVDRSWLEIKTKTLAFLKNSCRFVLFEK